MPSSFFAIQVHDNFVFYVHFSNLYSILYFLDDTISEEFFREMYRKDFM